MFFSPLTLAFCRREGEDWLAPSGSVNRSYKARQLPSPRPSDHSPHPGQPPTDSSLMDLRALPLLLLLGSLWNEALAFGKGGSGTGSGGGILCSLLHKCSGGSRPTMMTGNYGANYGGNYRQPTPVASNNKFTSLFSLFGKGGGGGGFGGKFAGKGLGGGGSGSGGLFGGKLAPLMSLFNKGGTGGRPAGGGTGHMAGKFSSLLGKFSKGTMAQGNTGSYQAYGRK